MPFKRETVDKPRDNYTSEMFNTLKPKVQKSKVKSAKAKSPELHRIVVGYARSELKFCTRVCLCAFCLLQRSFRDSMANIGLRL